MTATPRDETVTPDWSLVAGATSHELYWATSPGVTKTTGTALPGLTPPHLHTGPANGTTCYHVVTAVSGASESPESPQASAMPLGAPAG